MSSSVNEKSSVDDVVVWLNSNGLEEVSQTFHDEGIDGDALSCLTERALETLVTRVGPRMKLLRMIKPMQNSANVLETQSTSSSIGCWESSDVTDNHSGGCNTDDNDIQLCSASLTSSPNSMTKRKWETPFHLPTSFQPVVNEALSKKSAFTKTVRCKFIQAIYDRICLFTISPTPDQRREVCKAIITKYPFLGDSSCGYEIWYRQIGDKIKNELRNERTDPIVVARKRKNVDGSPKPSKVQVSVRRGIVNWAPPAIDGEDKMTCKSHMAWMQREKKRKQFNRTLVDQKMRLTYPFRRELINEMTLSLKEIQMKYPFLFEEQQLRQEYNRLMAEENAADCARDNLLELAPKIILLAEKKNLGSDVVQKLLKLCQPSLDDPDDGGELNDEEKTFVALCLLPYLLERPTKANPNPESFLYQFGDANEVVKTTKPSMSPFIIFSGSLEEPQDMFIGAEKEIILEASGILDAAESLLFLYYVCNLEYPKECFNTYFFLQRHVLKVFDKQRVPTKVLMLMSDLSQL